MKGYWLLLLVLMPLGCIAKLRVVPITNGNLRSIGVDSLDEHSHNRLETEFQLPAHTVGLVYMISTYGSIHSSAVVRPNTLLAQVSKLLSDGYAGKIESVAAQMLPASTAALIDAYLFNDLETSRMFVQGQSVSYSLEYSKLHFNGGTVSMEIAPSSKAKSLWLGIKNLSEVHGIAVSIEAVALVDDDLK